MAGDASLLIEKQEKRWRFFRHVVEGCTSGFRMNVPEIESLIKARTQGVKSFC
jgi:hypothetical protein